MYNKTQTVFDKTLSLLNNLASLLIIVISVWIVLDVLGRLLFNHPLVGTPEIAANTLAAIAFLQMPKVLRSGKHIRSELVLSKVGPTGKAWVEIVSSILGIGFFVLAIVSSWEPTISSWVLGEYEGEGALRIPSFPVRTIILIGSVLMVLQFAANLVASLKVLAQISKARKEQQPWNQSQSA